MSNPLYLADPSRACPDCGTNVWNGREIVTCPLCDTPSAPQQPAQDQRGATLDRRMTDLLRAGMRALDGLAS